MDEYTDFKFTSTYTLCGHLRDKILENDPGEYITDHFDINNKNFQKQLLKPQKWTILHDIIEYEFTEGVEYMTRKLGNEVVSDWKRYLSDYDVSFPSESQFHKTPEAEDKDYVDKLAELVIKKVSLNVVEETFTIMFSDRKFLMELNKIVATVISPLKKNECKSLLQRDGVIKRCTQFNEWVKRAVFLRDKGSCAICLTDLTGLIKTGYKDAIDHIVPLNLGGSNDITNLQQICRKCNNEKLGHTIRTSEKYAKYY